MLSKQEREALTYAQDVLQQKIKDFKRDLTRFQDAGDKVQTRLLNNWIDEHQNSCDGLTQILSWSAVREYVASHGIGPAKKVQIDDVVGDALKDEQ